MPARILVIDDEDSMCNFMEIMLTKEGYRVDTAGSGKAGVILLKENNYDLVLADLSMPEMSGIDVLREIKAFKSEQDLIVMTAYASVDSAIEAMKQGALDYVTKPFKIDEIKLAIERSIRRKQLISENQSLKKQLEDNNSFDNFLGASESVVLLKKLTMRIAASDSTVLVLGESGTGKDLITKALHHHSPRSNGPFVTINCAALPETLLESELFGHKKGAFTGAISEKEGLFQVADGGTFFLDEVGNISTAIQVKLLRVLEDKKITPVGGTSPVEVDVRLVAATNSDLEEEVRTGRFRSDLFYRLNVVPIHIPPLRERKEDIKLLTGHFVSIFCQKLKLPVKVVSPRAMAVLENYWWPGNVRELENTIERAVLLNRTETLDVVDFPEKLRRPQPVTVVSEAEAATPTLESIEKAYIHYVMSQTGGKKAATARILGIDTSTLYRKIQRYQMREFLVEGSSRPKPETKKK
ncbi:MAG: sigma-54 dependent transcriptional regulator [bacterium]